MTVQSLPQSGPFKPEFHNDNYDAAKRHPSSRCEVGGAGEESDNILPNERLRIMKKRNLVLSEPIKDFYNRQVWSLLDLNDKQFLIAWRAWQRQRQEKKDPKARVDRIKKRLR